MKALLWISCLLVPLLFAAFDWSGRNEELEALRHQASDVRDQQAEAEKLRDSLPELRKQVRASGPSGPEMLERVLADFPQVKVTRLRHLPFTPPTLPGAEDRDAPQALQSVDQMVVGVNGPPSAVLGLLNKLAAHPGGLYLSQVDLNLEKARLVGEVRVTGG